MLLVVITAQGKHWLGTLFQWESNRNQSRVSFE